MTRPRQEVLVTRQGECFECRNDGEQRERGDSIGYRYYLRDLKQERGEIIVDVFVSGTLRATAPNFNGRFSSVSLNALRRAFDTGVLTFSKPADPISPHEISLSLADFHDRPAATDKEIRTFVEHKAYWESYINSPGGSYPVQFDDCLDLEYLPATRDAIQRNIRFLAGKHLLEKTEIEGLGRPTSELVEQYESQFLTPRLDETTDRPRVFVVHGHDEEFKNEVARLLGRLNLDPVILHLQPNRGFTIIEKFEANSDVHFAIILMSPDDVGSSATDSTNLKARARQNVILELGYFIGKLTRKKVCAIHKAEIELPSDLHGVIWIQYDNEGMWQKELQRELQAAQLGGIDQDEESTNATALLALKRGEKLDNQTLIRLDAAGLLKTHDVTNFDTPRGQIDLIPIGVTVKGEDLLARFERTTR